MTALLMRHPLWALSLPVLVWAAHFLVVYSFAALVCVADVAQRQTFVAVATGVATVVALAIIAAASVLTWRGRSERGATARDDNALPAFVATGAVVLAVLSALGVAWVAVPTFLLPPCVP